MTKPAVKNETFYQDMLQLQTDLCAEYAKEVRRLRLEVARLQKIIDEYPSDASAMQDRITMLEARAGAHQEEKPC